MPETAAIAPAIVWFRDDLRLADHPALARAAKSGAPLVCVYVLDDLNPDIRTLGSASRWWLHRALQALDTALAEQGGSLLLLRGDETRAIAGLAESLGAGAVYWNRRYALAQRTVDAGLKASLRQRGLTVESAGGSLLFEPWEVQTGSGGPFRVYTPFWRAACKLGSVAPPLPAPAGLSFARLPAQLPMRATLEDLKLLPQPPEPDWAGGMRDAWTGGEAAATERLTHFLARGLHGYAEGRDRPDQPATSRLSPYLRFGEVSPRQAWHAVQAAEGSGREKFLAELGWREFCYSLLYHYPDLPTRNFRREFDDMPWRDDPAGVSAWQRGQTGYPLVDAGMRELWTTGWMHNRVRMVVASFLVKHLLVDWRVGEAWFWDTLVDADPASNVANWQWVAGCGADAAPYFRVFNPILQGTKFDPKGDYVRRWVPELAGLPAAVIHEPWKASAGQLSAAGVKLGRDYPEPIIVHEDGRKRALAAFATLTGKDSA
ncbi:deoxyribodipyrimidine photo-lyase [Bordetella ansorpii]|uniref:Deoxyribodipyrimidine photo-lyase n=1 Tax=Bordetella ansorpii TaxID=288768 RepID=A0A157STZ2_9BORD|nr:deoxyribodipyrimidine photo-lyase [Bordetella ansorpii]SAI73794.1 deoxyribodipyrimidine photo-lyase [Bordetella ansorpii]